MLLTHNRSSPPASLVQQLHLKHAANRYRLLCEYDRFVVALKPMGNTLVLIQPNILSMFTVERACTPRHPYQYFILQICLLIAASASRLVVAQIAPSRLYTLINAPSKACKLPRPKVYKYTYMYVYRIKVSYFGGWRHHVMCLYNFSSENI